MKLLVAIPAYDGGITVETARSLLNEQGAAALTGVEFEVAFLPRCSLITQARDQLANQFMASDADKMIFLDSDVAWEPGAMLRLASHDVDFVGGAYRLKQDVEAYPVTWLEGEELYAVNGLLEVETLPGGFLCLSKRVFETLAKPEHVYSHFAFTGFAFFHVPRGGGEDTRFCLDWRDAGGKVWLDPEHRLTHVAGSKSYTGHIGEWIKNGSNHLQ